MKENKSIVLNGENLSKILTDVLGEAEEMDKENNWKTLPITLYCLHATDRFFFQAWQKIFNLAFVWQPEEWHGGNTDTLWLIVIRHTTKNEIW